MTRRRPPIPFHFEKRERGAGVRLVHAILGMICGWDASVCAYLPLPCCSYSSSPPPLPRSPLFRHETSAIPRKKCKSGSQFKRGLRGGYAHCTLPMDTEHVHQIYCSRRKQLLLLFLTVAVEEHIGLRQGLLSLRRKELLQGESPKQHRG